MDIIKTTISNIKNAPVQTLIGAGIGFFIAKRFVTNKIGVAAITVGSAMLLSYVVSKTPSFSKKSKLVIKQEDATK